MALDHFDIIYCSMDEPRLYELCAVQVRKVREAALAMKIEKQLAAPVISVGNLDAIRDFICTLLQPRVPG